MSAFRFVGSILVMLAALGLLAFAFAWGMMRP
jgi:hypothetical protein